MKSFLDHNAIFLVNVRLPRDVRCYCCKASNEEASLYLNHNSIGEALILCPRCHQTYQKRGPQERRRLSCETLLRLPSPTID